VEVSEPAKEEEREEKKEDNAEVLNWLEQLKKEAE